MYEELAKLIKEHKVHHGTAAATTKKLKKLTKMSENALIGALVELNKTHISHLLGYKKMYAPMKKEIDILKSDLEVLRNNRDATESELRDARFNNAVHVRKYGVTKEIIEGYLILGFNKIEIADLLEVSLSTIYKRLREGEDGEDGEDGDVEIQEELEKQEEYQV